MTPTCAQITQEAEELISLSELDSLHSNPKVVTINGACLQQVDAARFTGVSGGLYLTIALTSLDSASGRYTFLRPDGASSEEEAVELAPGDAMAWKGDCVAKPGSGSGGWMLVVMYS
ncbi:hypothetical protein CERZMDRAFT_80722 [Cercospora zeae-maydis SCOH1-5]|uniref:Uncharacterized protein n=1 Tax=Cercospora zeae-maydis SCOH1-5 TaxID=717836 RepID=A0A6A6FTM3_9PEZI|nr:hypothetical protein CERZMDRAFT_80722 [Cercospora zeae-maydis SCOH1-5]